MRRALRSRTTASGAAWSSATRILAAVLTVHPSHRRGGLGPPARLALQLADEGRGRRGQPASASAPVSPGHHKTVPKILYRHPGGDRVGEDGPVERHLRHVRDAHLVDAYLAIG